MSLYVLDGYIVVDHVGKVIFLSAMSFLVNTAHTNQAIMYLKNQTRPSKPSGSSGSNAASSGATGQSNPPHQNKAHKPSSSQGTFKKPNTPLTTRPKQAQNTRQNHNNNNPHQNNSQQGQVRSRPQGNRPEAIFRPPPPIRHTTPI